MEESVSHECDTSPFDYDAFVERAKIGGTFTRYYLLHFLTIVTGIISGSFIFYSIYYFEMEP